MTGCDREGKGQKGFCKSRPKGREGARVPFKQPEQNILEDKFSCKVQDWGSAGSDEGGRVRMWGCELQVSAEVLRHVEKLSFYC